MWVSNLCLFCHIFCTCQFTFQCTIVCHKILKIKISICLSPPSVRLVKKMKSKFILNVRNVRYYCVLNFKTGCFLSSEVVMHTKMFWSSFAHRDVREFFCTPKYSGVVLHADIFESCFANRNVRELFCTPECSGVLLHTEIFRMLFYTLTSSGVVLHTGMSGS